MSDNRIFARLNADEGSKTPKASVELVGLSGGVLRSGKLPWKDAQKMERELNQRISEGPPTSMLEELMAFAKTKARSHHSSGAGPTITALGIVASLTSGVGLLATAVVDAIARSDISTTADRKAAMCEGALLVLFETLVLLESAQIDTRSIIQEFLRGAEPEQERMVAEEQILLSKLKELLEDKVPTVGIVIPINPKKENLN